MENGKKFYLENFENFQFGNLSYISSVQIILKISKYRSFYIWSLQMMTPTYIIESHLPVRAPKNSLLCTLLRGARVVIDFLAEFACNVKFETDIRNCNSLKIFFTSRAHRLSKYLFSMKTTL